jgi:hypothetical protein
LRITEPSPLWFDEVFANTSSLVEDPQSSCKLTQPTCAGRIARPGTESLLATHQFNFSCESAISPSDAESEDRLVEWQPDGRINIATARSGSTYIAEVPTVRTMLVAQTAARTTPG